MSQKSSESPESWASSVWFIGCKASREGGERPERGPFKEGSCGLGFDSRMNAVTEAKAKPSGVLND